MFAASNSKVHLVLLDVMAVTFSKPAAFLRRVGKGGEYALRRGPVIALNYERAVDYGLLFHVLLPSIKELVK
jgi:hypothetical protein